MRVSAYAAGAPVLCVIESAPDEILAALVTGRLALSRELSALAAEVGRRLARRRGRRSPT